MSGTTFSTYPVLSPSATQTAPRSGAAQAASVEQSYLAASAQYAAPAPMAPPAASYDPGPGLTTLALGEEDGGAMSMPQMSMPYSEPMAAPHQGGGFQVTTLAIGEEDGGTGGGGGYGTMSPIRDDHSIIGNPVVGGDYTTIVSQDIQQDGYGRMQPIYSPGEAEYPAFAQTSQTTDLLNFHPVARVAKVALPQSMPVAAPAPVAVAAPVTAQPVYAAPTPVGALGQDVPQSGSYQSVGSYEAYVGGDTAMPVETTAPADQYIETAPAYEPAGPVMAPPAMETVPAEPVYEPFQPSYESIAEPQPAPYAPVAPAPAPYEPVAPAPAAYEPVAPAPTPAYEPAAPVPESYGPPAPTPYEPAAPASYEPAAPAPAPYEAAPMPEPAPAYEAMPAYDSGAVAPAVAPAATYAPLTSMEPRLKPALFGKDTPFDYASGVEAVDPADGNPDYVAPAADAVDAPDAAPVEEAAAPATASVEEAAAPASAAAPAKSAEPEATYVEVSIDDYFVESTGGSDAPDTATAPAMGAPAATESTASAPAAAPPEAPATPAPTPTPAPAQGGEAAPEPASSLGGSYVVIDTPPEPETGASSGAGNAGPDAPGEDLRIITLAIGEEAGSQ